MPDRRLSRRATLHLGLGATGLLLTRTARAQGGDVTVIAANAVKEGLADVAAAFTKATGTKVTITWAGTVDATKRINAGEVFDIVLVGSGNVDQMIAGGKLAAGSRTDFAKTGIGIAVRAGLARPDVSTPDAVKAAVLAAASLAYSAGPSGAYMGELFKKMGIAEQVAPKAKQPSNATEVAKMLARGEVDLGFAQVSEFLNVPGIIDLGPLPAAIQNYTIYAAGLLAAAPSPEPARALLRALRAPDAAPAIRKMGMEPA